MSRDPDYDKRLTKEEADRMIRAVQSLADDDPSNHKCDNCGRVEIGTLTKLPPDWKYIAIGEGWESLDEVDNDTKGICVFCYLVVAGALKQAAQKPPTCSSGGPCDAPGGCAVDY